MPQRSGDSPKNASSLERLSPLGSCQRVDVVDFVLSQTKGSDKNVFFKPDCDYDNPPKKTAFVILSRLSQEHWVICTKLWPANYFFCWMFQCLLTSRPRQLIDIPGVLQKAQAQTARVDPALSSCSQCQPPTPTSIHNTF